MVEKHGGGQQVDAENSYSYHGYEETGSGWQCLISKPSDILVPTRPHHLNSTQTTGHRVFKCPRLQGHSS